MTAHLMPKDSNSSLGVITNPFDGGQYDAFIIVGNEVFLFVEDEILAVVSCKSFLNTGARA